jgi:hypothetical protein
MDRPENVRLLRRCCGAGLAVLAGVDVTQHLLHTGHHPPLVFWHGWALGYALYGGLGCAFIIAACKLGFGPWLKRKEGYYD